MFYTYLHRSASGSGEIFYVGKGTGKRAYHQSKRNPHWKNIVRKYGLLVEICATWESEEDAFTHEKFLIGVMRNLGIDLVNRTDGGEGSSGAVRSPETRAKYVHAHRQESTKSLHREGQTARWQNAEYQKFMSSATRSGWADPEIKARRLAGMERKWAEPGFREARAAAASAHYAKPESQAFAAEHGRKVGAARSKSVVCTSTGEVYASVRAASRALGVNSGHVSRCCHGKSAAAKGYSFRFQGDAHV